ncbi:hypothetical protein CHS0354_008930 [Potamilus streckersoni]|uniref:Uncharacterized protein n=1 Tax=Potamilus streckersoni TaxID=2493646 RepID=A0AAE0TIA6_9BIVA|nr:hypothetical protein CHS0354_008930 [Potamilus streckersoni]
MCILLGSFAHKPSGQRQGRQSRQSRPTRHRSRESYEEDMTIIMGQYITGAEDYTAFNLKSQETLPRPTN